MQLVPWTHEQKAAFLDMQFTAQKTHYEEYYPDCEFLVIEMDRRRSGGSTSIAATMTSGSRTSRCCRSSAAAASGGC